jgi:hypothetical protein
MVLKMNQIFKLRLKEKNLTVSNKLSMMISKRKFKSMKMRKGN